MPSHLANFFMVGSSPHTRGALTLTRLRKPSTRDHPRIRGEHCTHTSPCRPSSGIIPAYAGSTMTSAFRSTLHRGSSPHTRGAHPALSSCSRQRWIIPAYAGSTVDSGIGSEDRLWIIPAYAGSTGIMSRTEMLSMGSSPHTRGARRAADMPRRCGRDHPRIRGEHLLDGIGNLLGVGIIPAYAGST